MALLLAEVFSGFSLELFRVCSSVAMAGTEMEAEHFSPYRADGKLVSINREGRAGGNRRADESSMALCVS